MGNTIARTGLYLDEKYSDDWNFDYWSNSDSLIFLKILL